MAPRRPRPDGATTRPPEPLRPAVSSRPGGSLVTVRARRRRFSSDLPEAGETAGW